MSEHRKEFKELLEGSREAMRKVRDGEIEFETYLISDVPGHARVGKNKKTAKLVVYWMESAVIYIS